MIQKMIQLTPAAMVGEATQVSTGAISVVANTATVVWSLPVPLGSIVVVDLWVKAHDATANHSAIYRVTGAAKNRAGTTVLLGTSPIALEAEDSSWGAAVTIDDATDVIQLTATPDASNATVFQVQGSYFVTSIVPA